MDYMCVYFVDNMKFTCLRRSTFTHVHYNQYYLSEAYYYKSRYQIFYVFLSYLIYKFFFIIFATDGKNQYEKKMTKKSHMKMMILVMFQQRRQIKLHNFEIGWKLIVRTERRQLVNMKITQVQKNF